jgi:hypothetical protein
MRGRSWRLREKKRKEDDIYIDENDALVIF